MAGYDPQWLSVLEGAGLPADDVESWAALYTATGGRLDRDQDRGRGRRDGEIPGSEGKAVRDLDRRRPA